MTNKNISPDHDQDPEGKSPPPPAARLDTDAEKRKRDITNSFFLFALAALMFALPSLLNQSARYTHMMLVATDNLAGDRFENAVVYLTLHSRGGAKGYIVNKPVDEMTYDKIFDILGVRFKATQNSLTKWDGGPVETENFAFLHSDDVTIHKSEDAGNGLKLTDESMEMIRLLAKGEGPKHLKFLWGYSGWGPNQLEKEIERGSWYVIKADPDLIFHQEPETVWQLATERYFIEQETNRKTAGNNSNIPEH